MRNELPDDQLMALFKQGDTTAFDMLFRRHRQIVYGVARAILGDFGGAEDVMQEVFMKVIDRKGDYLPVGKFRSWILKITRNQALNRLEKEKKRQQLFEESGFVFLAEQEVDCQSPASKAVLGDRWSMVKRLMDELPGEQRQALTMYATNEMKYAEIAEVLELPINTVKTRIRTARMELARRIAKQESQQ